MVLGVLRNRMAGWVLPHRTALANARAAVARDRRAAAQRAAAEQPGDLASVIRLLAGDGVA